MSGAAPKRIAHVWTPDAGVVDVNVEEWPEWIVRGEWIYEPDIDMQRRPLVRRGRWSGVETVEYRSRRFIHCEDVPDLIEAYGITEEELHGNRPRARAAR